MRDKEVLDRLDRIERALQNVAAMLCPVCRDAIVESEHPKPETEPVKLQDRRGHRPRH